MNNYDNINRLLNKYSTKHPAERWSSTSEKRKDKIVESNQKLRLFDGINSEYFRLVGSQKDRARYLIKKLNFNNICPKCSTEQIIVLICYYVNCEYNRKYSSRFCKKVFKDYEISSYLVERFLVYLVGYIGNEEFSKKTVSLNPQ